MDLKTRILNSVISEFDEKGVRFTMDELADKLGISKRTIYENIGSKEGVIDFIIDEAFSSIKAQEKKIIDNPELTILDKLQGILRVMPELSNTLDYRRIYEIRKFYPKLYQKIERNLESGWDVTMSLLDDAVKQGLIKPVNPVLFKEIIYLTTSSLLKNSFLIENNITYDEAVSFLNDMIFNGILVKEGHTK